MRYSVLKAVNVKIVVFWDVIYLKKDCDLNNKVSLW